MPSATRESLLKAVEKAKVFTAIVVGIGLVLLAVSNYPGVGTFSFMGLILFLSILATGPLGRVVTLWNARSATSVVRVVGPIMVSHYKQGRSNRYRLRLDDDTVLTIDQALFGLLAREGELRTSGGDDGPSLGSADPYGDPVAEYEAASMTTTYIPDGPLLLSVEGPTGLTVYRDRLLRQEEPGTAEPGV